MAIGRAAASCAGTDASTVISEAIVSYRSTFVLAQRRVWAFQVCWRRFASSDSLSLGAPVLAQAKLQLSQAILPLYTADFQCPMSCQLWFRLLVSRAASNWQLAIDKDSTTDGVVR